MRREDELRDDCDWIVEFGPSGCFYMYSTRDRRDVGDMLVIFALKPIYVE